ncbi:MAG: glycosyltransferase family 4 protein [SAR324 cluster bacterium]|nr:glycosyltransferase family 4 protein [SAR324 cluster bacterium]
MKKENLFISIKPHDGVKGGGSNTFAWNFCRYLAKKGIPVTNHLWNASKAIIIAHNANLTTLKLAKLKGCFIIHRLDEEFREDEPPVVKKRHNKIVQINKLADQTVFQSEFVKNNVWPYLNSQNWNIIINGADPTIFKYQKSKGEYIGHITNSIGDKKRLDLLEQAIQKYPDKQFMLVGNHNKSSIDFSQYRNAIIIGPVNKTELFQYHQQMKCLYFPSERDPCPNTVVEAILSGLPICYNEHGGTKEIVKNCGLPLDQFEELLNQLPVFQERCAHRQDLYFDSVAEKYLDLM